MKNIYSLLFLLLFASNILQAQTTFTGVTVITHGFTAFGKVNSDIPGWMLEQARAILVRNGGGYIYRSNPQTGQWDAVDFYGSTGASRTHIVLLYDWQFSSHQFVKGNLEAAADNLFGMLMACPLIPKDTFWGSTINKHFIGHSRGGVLMVQLFHRVLKANPLWKIDHFTSLDPHPATKMLDQELPYVSRDGVDNNNSDRYKLELPANVLKADNYYRTDNYYELGLTNELFEFDGVKVVGAKTIKLNNATLDGVGNPNIEGGTHANVHTWYYGTINTNAIISDGLTNIPFNSWYGGIGSWWDTNDFGNATRNAIGFQYSYVGGWFNFLSNATSLTTSNIVPQRIFNSDFGYNGIINFKPAGWNANGGKAIYTTFANVGARMVTNPYADLRHSILLIPSLAKSLKFEAQFNGNSLSSNPFLQIKFYDIRGTSFPIPNCKFSTTNSGGKFTFTNPNVSELVEVCIPTELIGKAGTFSFTTSDTPLSSITVKNIVFIDNSGANMRVNAEQAIQATNTTTSYLDFPVAYNVEPNPLITGTQPTSFNATVTNSLSTTWSGTLTMTWRNVNDTGRGIQLATQNVTLAPNASVTLDRGTQQIISTAGEYVLSIYANNDTSPIDRYYYYVNEPPVVTATVINIEAPTTVSFGSVNVGGSFDKIITIKNASTSNTVLTGTIAPVNGVDMSIISGSQTLNLAPNQSQDITVRFSPLSGGVYNNSLSISGNFNGTSKSINLTGTGVTVLPTLTFSRATGQTYSLLDAQMGNFSDAIISVSNYSSSAFSGSFAIIGNGYSGFIIGGSGSNLNIPAGGSQNITVRFTPTANGISTGSLSITGSATNTPAIFNFSTLGTGFPTSGCVTSNIITKTSIVDISYTGWREFGRFTLTNTSSTLPANITNFSLGSSQFFRVLGYQGTQFSLNPNETREFVVDINPIATQGYYSGSVIIGTQVNGCNVINIDLRGTPSVTTLNAPELTFPPAENVYSYTGFDYGYTLQMKKKNVDGVAKYKYYLKDVTSNQIIFDYYDEGTYPNKTPETLLNWLTNNGITRTFKGVTGHRYAWKVRAENVNNPNIYTDSELRFFTAQQPSTCYSPTDLSISEISKNSAVVTWNVVPTVYANPATYNIELSSDNGNTYPIKVFNLTNPQTTITNLTNAQNYKVRVITNCLTGNINVTEYTRSQPSTDKPFTTLADCSTLSSSITPNSAQTICQGSSVNLTSSIGNSYKWYKDDVLITGATTQTYPAGQAGTYKVKVTYSNGCEILSNAVSISEIAKPNVLISSTSNGICPNASVNLSTSQISGTTYQWVKDGANLPNTNSNTYSAVSFGVYRLNYTQNGCTFTTDLLNLPALPTPTLYITGNNNLTIGNTMNLSAFGANTYSWTGTNFTSTATQITIPNMQTANAGNYSVVGTGTNGCTSSVNFTVTVSPATCTLMYTLKSGNWNDATVWSCGRIPTSQDNVTIKATHNVYLTSTQSGYCKFILVELNSILNVPQGAKIYMNTN